MMSVLTAALYGVLLFYGAGWWLGYWIGNFSLLLFVLTMVTLVYWLGERLRELMLDKAQKLHSETEALLMFAARREQLDKVILPALDAGAWVVCDRFTDATFAYQSGGSGLAWERIEALETWVQGGLQPDLTLYFDVPSEVGKARTLAAREPDRFEQEGRAFFDRVRDGYLRRAREDNRRVRIIDGTDTLENVKQAVGGVIASICF